MSDQTLLNYEPSETHVAVLMGGWSAEREVSLVSGAAYARACREIGYRVTEVDVDREVGAVLADLQPDIALNALHGQWGEDGCVQGLLEILNIPYTHSGVLASSLAMDKQHSKSVFHDAGIPIAESLVADRQEVAAKHLMKPPYVIKPVNQGSSVGVYLIRPGDNRPPEELTRPEWHLGREVMVEAYIPGRELTVGVMGDKALGVTEIVAHTKFYDYEAKYAPGGSSHVVPADVPHEIAEAAMEHALKAHRVLGCRGATRADFRYDDTGDGPGRLIILEINTQPGMTPTSLLPEQAQAAGISFNELVQWIVEDASCPR